MPIHRIFGSSVSRCKSKHRTELSFIARIWNLITGNCFPQSIYQVQSTSTPDRLVRALGKALEKTPAETKACSSQADGLVPPIIAAHTVLARTSIRPLLKLAGMSRDDGA